MDWDAPDSGAAGGYRVFWKTPSAPAFFVDSQNATVSAGTTEYTIPSLTNGATYNVRVHPLDASSEEGPHADAAEEVTVGQPRAVRNLTVAGRYNDFRVDWDAPDERGEGFLQDADGNPVLVYRISWKKQGQSTDLSQHQVLCRDGRKKTAVNDWFEITSVSPFNIESPQDGDTYTFTIEARFQAGSSVVTTNCGAQTDFGAQSAASATAGRGTASAEDHAAVRAALETVVDARDEQWPWLRTAWDHISGQMVQASDLDPGTEGQTRGTCNLTTSPDNLGGCTSTDLTIDMDWDIRPEETFDYVVVHELAHVWTLGNDLHNQDTRGPVGRALLYFFDQQYKGSSEMMGICATETLADALSHVAEGVAPGALGYYGDRCFSDGRTEPTVLTEEVTLHAMHPSGADPNGVDTTSSWFTDTFAGASASVWAAVSDIEFKRYRYLVMNLLQDEFNGLCSIVAANRAVFEDDSDVTDPWNDGGCEPDAPEVTAVAGADAGSIQVTWTAPQNSGGAPLLGYTVQWKFDLMSWPMEGFFSPTEQHVLDDPVAVSYTITGLIGGLEYTVRVRARNSIGDGVSADESVTAGRANRSDLPPPKNLRAVTGKGSVKLTWEAPDDATVTGYRIDRRRSDESRSEERTLVENTGNADTGYTDESSEKGVEYEYRVSARNEAGPGEGSDWVRAGPAPVSNDPATGLPTIRGAAQVGETLTAGTSDIEDADGLENVTFSYQWQADDADIPGATESTYTLSEAVEGTAISVQVSFTDDAGNAESLTSEDAAAWSAIMRVEWVYQGYGYYSTDAKKAGALSPASFKVGGTTYTVKMVETRGWMYIGVDRELPFDFVLELDGTRFASTDASFRSYSYGNIYRWEGTGLSWRDGDTVEVRLLRAFEDETAVNSAATGAPIISGTVQVGETLTADTSGIEDADGLGNAAFTYQWLADNAAIAGATGSTHTLADTDEGKTIKVRVSFTDDADNEETLTSAATDAVAAATQPNSPATGAPTISGTAQVGETLTADTSGIADEDGLGNAAFTYQWLADNAAIAGATGSTHTLADADEGKAIKMRVSFTDDGGNDETLTSAATDAVAAPEPPASPTGLSATASHDSVTLSWDDPGGDSITGYVILRRNRDIHAEGEFTTLVENTGGAATTYTDDTVEPETPYTYRIKAINEHGLSERSRWFHIDTPAAPVPASPTGLSATASHDSVTLTWDDPQDDSITGYVILRRNRDIHAEGEFTTLVKDTGGAATTYTDDSVASDTPYTYRIKAINEHGGVSERSRWFHIQTQEAP